MNLETGHDYFYVKDDVKRRFTFLGKKSAYPLAPVDSILWHDTNEKRGTCIGWMVSLGAKIKPVVNAGVELHRRTK